MAGRNGNHTTTSLLSFLFVLIFGLAASSWAVQKGRITGRVVRQDNGKPVPYANIIVAGTPFGAAADERGHFLIPSLEAGRYELICSAVGYRTAKLQVKVLSGQTTQVRFRLVPTPVQIQQLVVTASRFRQALQDVPATVQVLNQSDIRERDVVSLPEALAYVPGVQVSGSNISIRGSSGFSSGLGTRVLVLLDGVPIMSGDDGSANLRAIPLVEVQQVEVLKGANSALYGSYAMGGVVNIITRTPSADSSSYSLGFYSGFYSSPSYPQWRWTNSRRGFRGIETAYATAVGKMFTNFSATYNANDGFKENADFTEWNLFGRFRYLLNANHQIHITTSYYNREYGNYIFWKNRNHALETGNDPPEYYTRTRTHNSYIGIQWIGVLSDRLFIRVGGFHLYSLARDFARPRDTSSGLKTREYRRSGARTLRTEVQLDYQLGPGQHLITGLESSGSSVHSIQYGDHAVGYISYYGQFSSEFHSGWKITFGARYDQERGSEIHRSRQFNPKLGLVFTPNPAHAFRLSAGRGYRIPTVAERFISTVANQIQVQPNPALRPERNLSFEMGYRRYFGIWGYLDVSLFHTDYWDLIEPTIVSEKPEVQFRNITRARIRGLEISQIVQFRRNLRGEFGYTFIRTTDLSRLPNGEKSPDYGKEIKYRPNHLFFARLTYSANPVNAGVDFRYISKIKRVDRLTNIPDITLQVPAYIVDVHVNYRWRKWTLGFLVKNLLQYYYLESPGNLGELRNYTLRLNYTY